MLEFVYINPIELHDYWKLIKPGLKKVEKYGDHWLPEDIYASLKAGQAHLHIGYVDADYVGFVITQQVQAYDGPVLHIWGAYSEGENLLGMGMGHFKEWAANMKARRITFDSPREGWKRVGAQLGFRPTLVKYELEL